MYDVKRGDVWQLGKHRLMCGDNGNASDVGTLMHVKKASLVFTSPPYLKQRTYTQDVPCWDSMMARMTRVLPADVQTQIIVNLGIVYQNNEWLPYWDTWIELMQANGWRKFGWYIWDKLEALPGNRNGRLNPSFEFLFHFNKNPRQANKTVPCKHAGYSNPRRYNGGLTCDVWEFKKPIKVQPYKIMDATLRMSPEKNNKTGHPAVFPVSLPRAIINAYTSSQENVYDPFVGSGTTIIACEETGRIGYGMEIAPEYCEMALARWRKAHSEKQIKRVIYGDR